MNNAETLKYLQLLLFGAEFEEKRGNGKFLEDIHPPTIQGFHTFFKKRIAWMRNASKTTSRISNKESKLCVTSVLLS